MTFSSLLFAAGEPSKGNTRGSSASFADLHIDRIIAAAVKDREAYDLVPIFSVTPQTAETVNYRQDVFRDLESMALRESIHAFGAAMRTIRARLTLAEKSSYEHERNRWVLDSAHLYYQEVASLHRALSTARSAGLIGLREFLDDYVGSESFRLRSTAAKDVASALSRIEYRLIVGGNHLTVRGAAEGPDLVEEVETTFERFRQGAVKNYLLDFRESQLMNHIEAKVLEFVAKLNPGQFDDLRAFAKDHVSFIDARVERVDREFQFYLALIEYFERLGATNMASCYPTIAQRKSTYVRGGYDAALADHARESGGNVVRNDFELTGPERILVVSGPNQGGKTTFARMVGQIHYLASIGCRVPAETADVFLCDQLFSHFEREENPESARGKLEDDLFRMREILDAASPRSLIILNELFSSTTAQDASELSQRILKKILALDAFCVCVTFIDELASISERTISIVSLVDPAEADQRTFLFARRPPDGLAYALSLAQKYGLTRDRILQRLSDEAPA